MNSIADVAPSPADLSDYRVPSLPGSLWQITNSLLPYLGLWALMIVSRLSAWPYPVTLVLAMLASGFLVRIFIIFHDCGHGSFFRSRVANEWVGFFSGLLTMTPSHEWWGTHALHHARTGDLDRRGIGDVWTMTVEEFRAASPLRRLQYFLVRQPLFMLSVGPLLVFALKNRFYRRESNRKERWSVIATNLALAAIITTLCLTIGWRAYLAIHLPIVVMAGAAGIWLFYVQHQFESAYWKPRREWEFLDAAILGSSFYRLPRLLQWFSGNIGFHHIHHYSPKIPNYRLEDCHRAFAAFRQAPEIGLRQSLRCGSLRLWDSERGKLVGWRAARASMAD